MRQAVALLDIRPPSGEAQCWQQIPRTQEDNMPELKEGCVKPVGGPILPAPPAELTGRELNVLRALAHGLSNQESADALSISAFTLRSHVRSILSSPNFRNRTHAAAHAIEIGLAKPGRT
jgi:DNA-binding NarL/FixJ family response regulator